MWSRRSARRAISVWPTDRPELPNDGSGPAGEDINATLHQLSLELRRYVVRTHKVPKDFGDFVARSQVQAPTPPPGKRYAIEGQYVVLVKQ